nr:hypothetical protein [Pseudomonas sp. BIGb0427]
MSLTMAILLLLGAWLSVAAAMLWGGCCASPGVITRTIASSLKAKTLYRYGAAAGMPGRIRNL